MKHQPRKRFGQNFLHDQSIIARIISAINPQPEQHIIEIGPGQGALTKSLLESGAKLDLLEIDRDLIKHLQDEYQEYEGLTIHNIDALKVDIQTLLQNNNNGEKLRIVGNLPYNISTPLLFHLLNYSGLIQDMHFMLQKEVVDRIVAPVNSKQYGRLSVMIQYHCQVDKLFNVASGAFTPAPKVESAIVRLRPHSIPEPLKCELASLSQLVAQAFSQRRKRISNSLKTVLTKEQLESAGVDPNCRAGELSVADYIKISNNRKYRVKPC